MLGVTGGYWGLLGALTSFAYWGARSVFNSQLSTLNSVFVTLCVSIY